MRFNAFRSGKEVLEALGKNGEDRKLFGRMLNRGEVLELEMLGEKVYVLLGDVEKLYLLGLAEQGEKLKLCIETMRVEYEKRCEEKRELMEQMKQGSVKKEKTVSMWDDDRESKIVV